MHIHKVISYKNTWEDVKNYHQAELTEILDILKKFIDDFLNDTENLNIRGYRDAFNKIFLEQGWTLLEDSIYTDLGHKIYVHNLGPIKNNVCVSTSIPFLENLNKWLFQQTTYAGKFNIAKIPILLVPTTEFSRKNHNRYFSRMTFEMCQRYLEPLTPLSHNYPFLILGYSNNPIIFETEVLELEKDIHVNYNEVIIDKCIEFPPEYQQAGIGILNFFGTYIHEQYPNENTKIKIEQNGTKVRLIVETNDGEKEIVEKALEEYQLIVSGQKPPESFTKKDKLIVELKNEIRIAQVRIEMQQDIIGLNNNRVEKLLDIINHGLSNKNNISIDFSPNLSANCTININHDVSYALGNISELKELVPSSSPLFFSLNELEGSLEGIEKENNPDIIKKSAAMSKFKRIIETISDGNNEISKAIDTIETGWDIFKDLAGKYNSIAQWCGLPQVPTIFTK